MNAAFQFNSGEVLSSQQHKETDALQSALGEVSATHRIAVTRGHKAVSRAAIKVHLIQESGAWVRVLPPLLTQLPVNASWAGEGAAQEMGQIFGSLSPTGDAWMEFQAPAQAP